MSLPNAPSLPRRRCLLSWLCRLMCLAVILSEAASLPAQTCSPTFPLQPGKSAGWQGADAAYSIPLSSTRSVWIFGDTLFGPARALAGADPRMVHNSLGISRCSPAGRWTMDYLLRRTATGQPTSFFSPADRDHWYWAMDGVRFQDHLVLSLLCLRHPAVAQEAAFNFESCGTDLARLSLAGSLVSAPVSVQHLVPSGTARELTATLVIRGPYLYLFGPGSAAPRPLLVSRVPLAHLDAAAQHLTTLARNGGWQPGADPANALPLFTPAPSEMSIRYHRRWRRWLAVYKDPALTTDGVYLRSAPSLLGPWSTPRLLFAIRSLDPVASRPGIFCYAGKEHPELARGSELLVTYVCNARDPAQLLTLPALYTPKAVRVTLADDLTVVRAQPVP